MYRRHTLSTSCSSQPIMDEIIFVIPLMVILSPLNSELMHPHPYTWHSTSCLTTPNPRLIHTSKANNDKRYFHIWNDSSPRSHRYSSSSNKGVHISKHLSNCRHHLKGVTPICDWCASVNKLLTWTIYFVSTKLISRTLQSKQIQS